MFPFYRPWKHQKTRSSDVFRDYKMGALGFLVFSGVTKWEHWLEMGYVKKENF